MSENKDIKIKSGFHTTVGWIQTVIGALMIIVAIIAVSLISGQLKAQNMTVPGDAFSNAGKTVAGPYTAWSMQEIIQHHADNSTDGNSYSELGAMVTEAKETYGEDSEEAAALQAMRNTQMNAAFLRASLFTSIIAYGVSLLAAGTGVSILLCGTTHIVKRKGSVA